MAITLKSVNKSARTRRNVKGALTPGQMGTRRRQALLLKNRTDENFYASREWRNLRIFTLRRDGRRCVLCGTTHGGMEIDHIKPRSLYPELALEISNLQVLCRKCNQEKGNRSEADHRDGLYRQIVEQEFLP